MAPYVVQETGTIEELTKKVQANQEPPPAMKNAMVSALSAFPADKQVELESRGSLEGANAEISLTVKLAAKTT